MEKQIKEYLIGKYDPLGIVLAGYRVSGNYVQESDWDIYVFTDKEFEGEWQKFNGQTLDVSPVFINDLPKNFILNTRYHPEQFLKILHDVSGGLIEDVVSRTREAYIKGPLVLIEAIKQRLEKILSRYIQKIEGRREVPGYSFYYFGFFYETPLIGESDVPTRIR